jgi:hypothetical protein
MFSTQHSSLTGPDGQVIATYIWIEKDICFKYRTLHSLPEKCEGKLHFEFNCTYLSNSTSLSLDIPLWTHRDSSFSDEISEIILRPCALYKDPFHDDAKGILVL